MTSQRNYLPPGKEPREVAAAYEWSGFIDEVATAHIDVKRSGEVAFWAMLRTLCESLRGLQPSGHVKPLPTDTH